MIRKNALMTCILISTLCLAGPMSAATLSADRSVCEILPGKQRCTATLTWSSNDLGAQLYVRNLSSGSESVVSPSHSGNVKVTWILEYPGHRFTLRSGSNILAQRDVYGLRNGRVTPFQGGTNLQYYDLIPNPDPTKCQRGQFHAVKYYDADEITDILQEMRRDNAPFDGVDKGMRSLRIGIFYDRTVSPTDPNFATSGVLPVEYSGSQPTGVDQSYIDNIESLLTRIKDEGFERVVFSLFPTGGSDPLEANCCTQSLVAETMAIIRQIIPKLKESHLPYYFDLRNEGLPVLSSALPSTIPSNVLATAYAADLWEAFRIEFADIPTVGFSIAGDGPWQVEHRLRNAVNVYGNDFPETMSVHLYNPTQMSSKSEGEVFKRAAQIRNNVLKQHGNWIVGESFYENTLAAQSIAAAIRKEGSVLFLTHWPQLAHKPCNQVSVGQPIDFEVYADEGF